MRIVAPALLMVFLLNTAPTYSQNKDSLLRRYDRETIYQSGNRFIKDNKPMTFRDLGREFTSPRTQYMYRKSRKLVGVGRIFNLASLGIFVTSIFVKDKISPAMYLVGTGVLGLGSLYFQTSSSQYVQRAIWERNREVISAASP